MQWSQTCTHHDTAQLHSTINVTNRQTHWMSTLARGVADCLSVELWHTWCSRTLFGHSCGTEAPCLQRVWIIFRLSSPENRLTIMWSVSVVLLTVALFGSCNNSIQSVNRRLMTPLCPRARAALQYKKIFIQKLLLLLLQWFLKAACSFYVSASYRSVVVLSFWTCCKELDTKIQFHEAFVDMAFSVLERGTNIYYTDTIWWFVDCI